MSQAATEDADLPCPECGYDLRATLSGRCPECGVTFDRASLCRSQIAWDHRRSLGRVRAWWRTLWQSSWRIADFSRSISAPINWHAARRFWLINVLLLSVAGSALLFFFWDEILSEIGAALGIDEVGLALGSDSALVRPLLTTFAMPGSQFIWLVLFLLTCTGVQTYLFQSMPLPASSQDRAAAIGLYASGAFVCGLLLSVVTVLLVLAASAGLATFSRLLATAVLTICAVAWISILRTYRGLAHAGVLRSICIAIVIPVLWCLAALFWFFAIPWCIGLAVLIYLSVCR